MQSGFDRIMSLQELEQHDWGEPAFDSSLAATCHELRRKPLNQYTAEDLRIMIGQGIGLSFLVPLAVERLEAEPLAEGACYPGDLLAAISKLDETFWTRNADSLRRVRQVVGRLKHVLPTLGEAERQTVSEFLTGIAPALADTRFPGTPA
jgi:hypothetical protein